jgi:hypothetical protein
MQKAMRILAVVLALAIAGSRVIDYPHVGHVPMGEAADRSAADLEYWLEQVP